MGGVASVLDVIRRETTPPGPRRAPASQPAHPPTHRTNQPTALLPALSGADGAVRGARPGPAGTGSRCRPRTELPAHVRGMPVAVPAQQHPGAKVPGQGLGPAVRRGRVPLVADDEDRRGARRADRRPRVAARTGQYAHGRLPHMIGAPNTGAARSALAAAARQRASPAGLPAGQGRSRQSIAMFASARLVYWPAGVALPEGVGQLDQHGRVAAERGGQRLAAASASTPGCTARSRCRSAAGPRRRAGWTGCCSADAPRPG